MFPLVKRRSGSVAGAVVGDIGQSGASQVGGLPEVAEEGRLMTHRGQDASSQASIVGRLSQSEGLDEVRLGQAVKAAVVARLPRSGIVRRTGLAPATGTKALADLEADEAAERVRGQKWQAIP